MANSLLELMKSIEVFPVPKLSNLIYPEKECSTCGETPTVEENLDRLIITPETPSGWYTIGGVKKYLNNPRRTSYGVEKRHTIDLTPPKAKWTIAEPFTPPIEAPKPVYYGTNRELKKTTSIKYKDTINKPRIEERR